ncbi:NTF2-like protein [Gracilaria domingensis]|nr:NTF2-like protein [Gracilaria domingensis]
MVMAAVDAIRDLLDRGRETADNITSSVSARERRQLQLAESYIQLRMAGNNQKLLNLVSEDVELQSSRDGKFVGKQQFENYLSKVKPTGIWQNATWNNAINRAEILGNVKILMVNVGVVAHMGFNKSGKIDRIYVGTRSKSPK